MIERKGDDFEVGAALLAEAFGLSEPEIKARMRDGRITSCCEAGQGADAGRWRLTFTHDRNALRLIVDEKGNLLTRSRFPVSK